MKLTAFLTRVCLISMLGWSVASAQTAPIVRSVTIGVSYFYPPFVYSPSIGFDIGLMQGICTKEHWQCQFVAYTLEDMLKQLRSGNSKIDAAIGAISITEQRAKEVDFVGPYYQSSMSFVSRAEASNTLSLAQLKKAEVGTETASVFYAYLKNTLGLSDITAYDESNDMIKALSDHDVDVITLDTPVAEYWQKTSQCRLKIVGSAVKVPGDRGYGIVIRKGDKLFADALNDGLRAMYADGSYAHLVQMYFPPSNTMCFS